MIWKMMKLRNIKKILTSLGEVSNWFREEEEGEVSYASLELLHTDSCLAILDLNRYNTWKQKTDHNHWFCNHQTTYPAYLPSIFSSFGLGALILADPAFQPFLLHCPPIYIYTYFFQGLRLGFWAPLLLYLSKNLPRLSCLDRLFILYILK